jgi:CxxC motif-containing protein (DUF1111 family)
MFNEKTVWVHRVLFGLLAVALGCDSGGGPNLEVIPPVAETEIMVSGLTASEQADYAEGRELFFTKFDLDAGLGPFFAEQACGLCHEGAGRGPGKVLRIGRTINGQFDPMLEHGGPILQFRSAIPGETAEFPPPEAQFVNFRVAPPIWGRGYIQAIPDATILANADPFDLNGDGISGRANIIVQGFVGAPTHPVLGRHGLKAQMAMIEDFASNAFLQDLGMTTPIRPYELNNPHSDAKDGKKGIDISAEQLRAVERFIRSSEFPPMLPETPDITAGRDFFTSTGCVKCHIPFMQTGSSDIAALSNKTVFFYSDFLLHDMGEGMSDGVLDGDAAPREFKTPVLRGMRFFKEFLHDGRASTILQAIQLHDGEAAAIRNAFISLPQSDQQKIISFILSL